MISRILTPMLMLALFTSAWARADGAPAAVAPSGNACQMAFAAVESRTGLRAEARAEPPVEHTPDPSADPRSEPSASGHEPPADLHAEPAPSATTPADAAVLAAPSDTVVLNTLADGVMPEHLTPKQQLAWKQAQVLEQEPMSAAFPHISTRRDVTRVVVDPKQTDFYKKFDELWKAREDAGMIPPYEVRAFRRWMARNPIGRQDSIDIYTNYMAKKAPFSEYIDDKFLDFLEEEHGVPYASRAEYLAATKGGSYPTFVMGVIARKFKRTGATFKVAIVTGVAASLMAMPSDLITSTVISPIKTQIGNGVNWVINRGSSELANARLNWAKQAQLESDLNSLASISNDLGNIRLTAAASPSAPQALDRKAAQDALLQSRAGLDNFLPHFKSLIANNKTDFDTSWTDRLNQSIVPLAIQRSDYGRVKHDLDSLSSAIERRGTESTDDEKARLADYSDSMAGYEDTMASELADYIFYRSTRGSDSPLPETLERQYAPILKEYVKSMSMAKLRDKLKKLVDDQIVLVKGFMPSLTDQQKSVGLKVLEKQRAMDTAKADYEAKTKALTDATAASKVAQQAANDSEALVASAPKNSPDLAKLQARAADDEGKYKASQDAVAAAAKALQISDEKLDAAKDDLRKFEFQTKSRDPLPAAKIKSGL